MKTLVMLLAVGALMGCAHVKRDAVVDPGEATARVIQMSYEAGVAAGKATCDQSEKFLAMRGLVEGLASEVEDWKARFMRLCEEHGGRVNLTVCEGK